MNKMIPYIATHPGELIKDEITARKINQKQLSEMSGISPSILSETIKGKRSISLSMAVGLEKALDIPAEIWLNLQNQYELDSAGIKYRDSKSRFAYVRMLLEKFFQNEENISDADREELTKIKAFLSQIHY